MTVRVSKPAFNIREALNSLRRKIGIKGGELMAAETAADAYNVLNPVMFRNKLINGDFQVSQRGDYSTATSIATATYYLDRWVTASSLTATIQRNEVTLPDGTSTYSCKITSTQTGTGYLQIRQIIEGYKPFINKTITISAWIRSNKKDATGFGLAYLPTNANSWVISDNVVCDGAWRKYTYTVNVGAVSGNTIVGIQNNNSWTSGEYYEVALFQLEVGSVATPFEFRPYGTELALCQRYFYSMGGNSPYEQFTLISSTGSTDGRAVLHLPVPMRSVPTIIQSGSFQLCGGSSAANGTYSPGSSMYAASVSNFGGVCNIGFDFWPGSAGSFGVTNAGCFVLRANNSTATRLQFSAEL